MTTIRFRCCTEAFFVDGPDPYRKEFATTLLKRVQRHDCPGWGQPGFENVLIEVAGRFGAQSITEEPADGGWHYTIRLQGTLLPQHLEAETAGPRPHRFARSIVILMKDEKYAEGYLSWLEERFQQDCIALGEARATRLYWCEVSRSTWPLVVRASARAIKWIATCAVKRYFG